MVASFLTLFPTPLATPPRRDAFLSTKRARVAVLGLDELPCSGNCSGHGHCESGTCYCSSGWAGDD